MVKTLATTATFNASPHAFVTAAGTVVVAANLPVDQGFGQQVWAWQSTDGGATFAAGIPIMPVVPGQSRNFADAALGPGDALSVLNEVPDSGRHGRGCSRPASIAPGASSYGPAPAPPAQPPPGGGSRSRAPRRSSALANRSSTTTSPRAPGRTRTVAPKAP
jgi:hypothetical protein